MPIHDQGYRRYGGERVPTGRAWTVIAKTGIRMLLGRRMFVTLLLVSWFPFFVRAVQVWAATNFPQAPFLAVTPQMFRQFLGQQEGFLLFVTIYAGSGLIANDRRANALQIYLSKPLTRGEYIFGKLAILVTFLLLVTWVPAIVLLAVQVMFSGSFRFVAANLQLFPAITLFSSVLVLSFSSLILALSSLSRNSRYVGILFIAVLFFSQALYGVLFAFTRDTGLAWVSFLHNLNELGDAIFRLPLSYKMPAALSAILLALVIAASFWVLQRRVHAVEIVA